LGFFANFRARISRIYEKLGSWYGDKPPDGSVVNISPNANYYDEILIRHDKATMGNKTYTADAPDNVVEGNITKASQIKDDENDEDYNRAYYPAGGMRGAASRPNIAAILIWVEKTKLGRPIINNQFSRINITEQAGKPFGYIPSNMTVEDEKKRIDKIAYLVARKIWYVGRKPSSMSDTEWDKLTKHMRPVEGSFHLVGRDEWGDNFPYDQTYKYRSGYVNE